MTYHHSAAITLKLSAAHNLVDYEDAGLSHITWCCDAWRGILGEIAR